MLGLEELLDRKPANLSGGQRQRVAMGRAIARQPQLFLMDEPLSNLDAKLRVHMRAEIARLQRELGVTTLYVTHDQVEAMTMGGRIAVMRRGELQQFGSPQELYDHPVNLFVASFLGSPSMNLLKARVVAQRRQARRPARRPRVRPARVARARRSRPSRVRGAGRRTRLPARAPAPGERRSAAQLQGSVLVVESLGSELLVHVEIRAEQVLSEAVLEGSTVEQDEHEMLLSLETSTRRR